MQKRCSTEKRICPVFRKQLENAKSQEEIIQFKEDRQSQKPRITDNLMREEVLK